MAASRLPPLPPRLPADLAGPVTVALAQSQETIPGARALAGGCVYELKWDGFRCVIVRDGQSTRLWSRQGTDLTNRFPEIAVAAAAQIPAGTVIDGEVVIWNEDRLDFDLLQRRLASGAARIRELVKHTRHRSWHSTFSLPPARTCVPNRGGPAAPHSSGSPAGSPRCSCPPPPKIPLLRGPGWPTTAPPESKASSSKAPPLDIPRETQLDQGQKPRGA
jgi:hypothetical protein